MLRNVCVGMVLAVIVVSAGCADSNVDEQVGRIDLALTGQTPSGTVYRLRQATIDVVGTGTSFTFNTEDDPARTVIQETAPVGQYALTLRAGWSFERVVAGAPAVPVLASLTSQNPQTFEITEGGNTIVKLRFHVDGDVVETGSGDFGVAIEVDDTPACDPALPCPASSAGFASVCGRIFDTETGARVGAASAEVYSVKIFDPLAFRADPTTPPLVAGPPDACGRFAFTDVPVPATGLLSAAVTAGTAPTEPVISTAVAVPAAAGAVVDGVRAFSTRATTEQAWAVSAGLAPGSIAQTGAYLAVFLAGGLPVAGVTMLAAGAPSPASDFYFSDASPLSRRTVDPLLDVTGANGAALFLDGPLTQYSGAGPAGCSFPALVGGSSPGIIVVQLFPGTCQ